MITKRAWLLAATASATLFLAGCATPSAPQSVADAIAADPQLTRLHALIQEHGLAPALAQPGPFTVFAPTDDAFKAIPARAWDSLAKDRTRVAEMLKFHVVPGTMMASNIRNGSAPTLQGKKVALSQAGSFATVEDAVVTKSDITAANGVVHHIDRVLVPPTK